MATTKEHDEASTRVHGTVSVRVTIDLSFSQGFGGEWSLNDIRAAAIKQARGVAAQMADGMRDGRATVVSVDPNVSIRLAVTT